MFLIRPSQQDPVVCDILAAKHLINNAVQKVKGWKRIQPGIRVWGKPGMAKRFLGLRIRIPRPSCFSHWTKFSLNTSQESRESRTPR